MNNRTRITILVICGLLPWTPLIVACFVGWKPVEDFFYSPVFFCYFLAVSLKPFEVVVAKGFQKRWQRVLAFSLATNFLILYSLLSTFGFDPIHFGKA